MNSGRGAFRLLLLMVVMVLLAACGGGSVDSGGLASISEGGATTTTIAAATEADTEEVALAFSQCMRDEGVSDFPDPNFSGGGGGIAPGGGPEGGIDFQSEEVQAAFEVCNEVLEGAAFGPGGGDFDVTELQDSLLAMADCLRDQGFEVDDPDLSNFGPGAGGPAAEDDSTGTTTIGDEETGGGPGGGAVGIFGDLDLEDPTVQAAVETCQDEVGFNPGGGQQATAPEDDGR